MHTHRKTGLRVTDRRGQSMVELAVFLPVLCFLLLAVVDLARAYSVERRLEQAAHLAALATADPTFTVSEVIDFIALHAGLPSSAVAATRTYSADPNGNNHVTITAGYSYPLLLPGLRNLQVGGITNGTLPIGVQASGIAPTDPPTVSCTVSGGCTVTPFYGAATPSGLLHLVCTLFKTGVPVLTTPECSSAQPLSYTDPISSSDIFTATVTQADGVVSSASAPWSAP